MAETTGRKQASRWPKGVSGNPRGRPPGSKHAALLALDAIGASAAADVLASVVNAAKSGDVRAAEVLLRRVWPERKGRPVAFDFPTIGTTADVTKALGAVVALMASGELTPEEATAVSSVIEMQRRGLETEQLEKRVFALERMALESSKP